MGEGESEEIPTSIPPNSPLRKKLAQWNYDPSIRDKDELKMLQYWMTEWTKEEIRSDHVHWPRYGLDEGRICRALNTYVRAKQLFNQEESDYAAC